jgi:ATP-dependent RNA helicase SUPV3L1/SUV3
MKSIIQNLIGEVEIQNKERFSKITYGGYKKISRLDGKAAIIAFSIEEVYAIAELVRRQKGGAAVIMGSLSPKTRNSQVSLYQSGDVNFLVATDAIGMGLNMDINEIYFSNLKKFDGKKTRRLNLIEISQIAGRAGRYKNDGFFGTTGDCENLNSDEIENIEKHRLPNIRIIYWRNSNLDFNTPEKLIASLELKPQNSNLMRTQDSLDESVLRHFLKKGANNVIYHKNLELLWECCQIPDFEKKAYGQHINIVDKVFKFLTTKKQKIPNDYMKEQLKGLDGDHGNIDVLSHRISNVRTWSYVANKKNWIENSDYWIQQTKSIEDKLSDKLHEELTRSFIDKKISILSKNLKQDLVLNTKIDEDNKILIDEQHVGELKGLKFQIALTSKTLDTDIKSMKKAARKGVSEELKKRVQTIKDEKEITLDDKGRIIWKGNQIARLQKGQNYLSPEFELIYDDSLDNDSKVDLENFLKGWIEKYLEEVLGDLIKLIKTKISNQYLRALVFQLYEQNGVIVRDEIDHIIKLISADERKKLWNMGIKIGRYHVYLLKMLKPKAVSFRLCLWKLFNNVKNQYEIPKSGLNFLIDKNYDKKILLLCGFENFGKYFVRIDILEKLFIKILDKTINRKFKINAEMMNLLGCTKDDFNRLMTNMNYKKDKEEDTYIYLARNKKKIKVYNLKKDANPFSKLLTLNIK